MLRGVMRCPQCNKQWYWDGKPVRSKDWLQIPERIIAGIPVTDPASELKPYRPKPTPARRATCPRCFWKPKYEQSRNDTDTCLCYRQRVKKGMVSGG